jgi:hypothetical protein
MGALREICFFAYYTGPVHLIWSWLTRPRARSWSWFAHPIAIALGCSACITIGDQGGGDGTDTPPDPAPFAGNWVSSDDVFDCTFVLILGKKDGADAYEADHVCTLLTGELGVQVETGSYAVDSLDNAAFSPSAATCAEERVKAHTERLTLLDVNHLAVKSSTGTRIYEQVAAAPIDPGTKLGCFAPDGAFESGELTNL